MSAGTRIAVKLCCVITFVFSSCYAADPQLFQKVRIYDTGPHNEKYCQIIRLTADTLRDLYNSVDLSSDKDDMKLLLIEELLRFAGDTTPCCEPLQLRGKYGISLQKDLDRKVITIIQSSLKLCI